MAAREVLTNKDLVGHIYEVGFWRKAALAHNAQDGWSKEHVWRCIRELATGANVSCIFRQACSVFLKTLWRGYERQMRDFDKGAAELLKVAPTNVAQLPAWSHPEFLSEVRNLALKCGGWAELVFGFDKPLLMRANLTQGMIWAAIKEIDRVILAVRPTTYEEMLYMIEMKCACCGDRCRHFVSRGGDAVGMHPYAGNIYCSHFDETCGCPVYAQSRQYIPHTWSGHLAPVAFIRNEDGKYTMQLRIGCGQMSPGEREVHHFMIGARYEPWYQSRIQRLFELRPDRVTTGLQSRCCHRARTRRFKSIEFTSHIFLLAPRIPNNADWSIEQIFGLNRKETLAYVRRGRLILRERRALCTGY